ncbi:MAG: Clp1/GlmU family protein [Candidatus Jordarchaeales archaeon]
MECIETVNDGECILIKGPANIEVKEGKVKVLGGTFNAGERIVIPKGKALPLKACTPTTLKIMSSSIERIKEDIPSQWRIAVEELDKAEKPVVVLVIGGVDTGKTTLTTLLGNMALEKGLRVAIVDADVGQSDIGPPCFVAMGLLNHSVSDMSKVELKDAYFIGSTTPSAYPHRMIAGVKLMVERALMLGSEVVLIDTPGWISGFRARDLNVALVYVLQPSMIIALQNGNEAEGILKAFSSSETRVIRLPALASCKRDRETRKFLRETAYRRHLSGSINVELDIDRVSVVYTTLFSGSILNSDDKRKISEVLGINPVYAEASFDTLTLILPSDVDVTREKIEALRLLFKGRELHLLRETSLENILVALLDRKNMYLGVGILKKLDYAARKMVIYTPVSPDKIATVLFGSVKVVENGEEIGSIRYGY